MFLCLIPYKNSRQTFSQCKIAVFFSLRLSRPEKMSESREYRKLFFGD